MKHDHYQKKRYMIICILPITIFIHRISFSQEKYDNLLNNPLINQAIIWEDESGATAYSDWSASKKADLQQRFDDLELGADFPLANPPELTDDEYFSEADAWMIYLTHIAHSLWLEANYFLSWRLTDLTHDQLLLLFDSQSLIRYDGPDQYRFDAYNGLGRVTDWNIRFSYEFMTAHEFIKSSQQLTAMAFASWCRTYVRHISGSNTNPDGYETLYGYRGFPRVDRILAPLATTYGHISPGCWGTTGLFSAVMRSVNIPVKHGYSIFATPGSTPSAHSRIELPTLGIGLCHSDDLYNMTCKPTGSVIPTEDLFRPLDWLQNNITDPLIIDSEGGITNTKYEQAMYNAGIYLIRLAVNGQSDYILYQRAQDGDQSNLATNLESTLIGPSVGGGTVQFAKPYFSESERQSIISLVDSNLIHIGSGNWNTGAQIVIDRYNAPYEKDNWSSTVVESRETLSPSSPLLFQNFPNPFNSSTTVRYDLPVDAYVKIVVFNTIGEQIKVLENTFKSSGPHALKWDGKDESEELVTSGIYIIRLQAGEYNTSIKTLLIE